MLVVEVVSPDDETFEKFDFYARHSVRGILTADPRERRVRVWVSNGGTYAEAERSALLDSIATALTAAVRWPSIDVGTASGPQTPL